MRATRARGWAAVATLLVVACGAPDPVVTTTELRVVLPEERSGCRPASPLAEVELRALGDLPAAETDRFIELLRVADGVRQPIDRFPLETRVVSIRALGPWPGAGLYRVPEGDAVAPVLLLPPTRSCAVADPELEALEGAALVALPDGGLLVVGGEDGDPRRRLVRMKAPGGGLAEVLTLFDARAHASATRAGGRVVIAGGRGGADTWEVFDPATGEVLRRPEYALPDARSHHGALALEDGSVWLVGGLGRDGDVLRTIVRLDPVAESASVAPGTLAFARSEPEVLRLDDGRVFVAGGRLTGGGVGNGIEWLDTESGEVQSLGESFESRTGAVPVALPGARIAWIGNGPTVEVLSFADGGPLSPVKSEVELPEDLPALAPGEAVVLADGDVLVAGGFVVDVGRGAVERRDVPAGRRLVALADGSIAEIGRTGSGSSLRRERLRTEFDNPPATLLPTDDAWLASDPATGFVHLPTLRFADVRIRPRFDGPADLYLRDERGETVRVVLDPERTEIGLCQLDHLAGADVLVERIADQILLRADDVATRCNVSLLGRVAVSFQLLEGTTFVSLGVERL